MIQVLVLMFLGWLVGLTVRGKKWISVWIDRAILIAIFLLLFFMGLGIGSNKLLLASLPTLGYNAIIITIGATFGSILAGWAVWKFVFSPEKNPKK